MADEQTIYTEIDLHSRKIRRTGRITYPRVSSITAARWPNELGASPDEVLGKRLKVEEGGTEAIFRIDRIDGDTLHLKLEPGQ